MTGYRIVHYDAGTHHKIPSVHDQGSTTSLSGAWEILDHIMSIDGARRLDHMSVYIPGSSIDHVYTIEVAE